VSNRITRTSVGVVGLVMLVALGGALLVHSQEAPAALAQSSFDGGAGTRDDPYLVATAAQLDSVRQHLDAHFRLTADINLGVAPYSAGAGWQPIGAQDAGQRFSGSLDGHGHVIYNLTINRPLTGHQGLFGYLDGVTVRNLTLENVAVHGRGYTGGLAGRVANSLIAGVKVSGQVKGETSTGGLAGDLDLSTVHLASSSATVQGTDYTGGLAGSVSRSTLYQSHSTGSVSGVASVGGLAGSLTTSVTLIDTYSRAAVHGESRVGGLVGLLSSTTLRRAYSTGQVTATTATSIGGLIGEQVPGSIILDCTWDTQTSGQAESAGGAGVVGKTTAEMQQATTFPRHNFGSLWRIDEGRDYPVFQELSTYALPQPVTLTGDGTPESPYLIHNAAELNAMREVLTATYRLANDIDLTATVVWDNGKGWLAVGSSSTPFSGALDGAGYAVRYLTMSRPATQYQGLFGYLNGATVSNLRVESVSIEASSYTGGLAGQALTSRFQNVQVSGEVTGDIYTGGLVGYLQDGNIFGASSSAAVRGSDTVGGLVGYTRGAVMVVRSHSRGSVVGSSDVGGLVGWHYGAVGGPTIIADSYSWAAVSAASRVGGLVGYNYYAFVYRSYSTGQVTGSSDVGGLVGLATPATGYLTNCLWDTESSGQATSAGGDGVAGKTTTEMQQRTTFGRFRFAALWQMDEGQGYPTFGDVTTYTQPQPLAPDGARGLGQAPFSGGAGTDEDPYIITTAGQLDAVRLVMTATYQLGADIDLADSVVWDGGQGWTPIGNSTQPFSGTLDGAGYTIRNLTVSRPRTDYQGLFGNLSGATVRNLTLEGVSVHGRQYVGGLAGFAAGSAIQNVRVEGEVFSDLSYTGLVVGRADDTVIERARVRGKVAGGQHYTGGLAGYLSGGTIHDAASAAQVLGSNYTGGLVGYTYGAASIFHSYSLGEVQGAQYTGGLVGWHSTHAVIADGYSRAAVTGTSYVGGLVSYLGSAYVYRSYSAGPVTGATNVGGFLGYFQWGTLADCYWDVESSGQATSAGETGVAGKSTAEMQQLATFSRYNFGALWQIDEGRDYPVFQDLTRYAQPLPVAQVQFDGGDGSPGSPYIITTPDQLNAMRRVLTATYQLGADIDLAATVVWDGGRGWTPVGVLWGPLSDPTQRFKGSLDGAGFAIRNLAVIRFRTAPQGFFGHMENATIENLRLENVSIYTDYGAGGLAGSASGSTIQNVHVSGEVLGTASTGGLVGFQTDGAILNGSNTAWVQGGNGTGGVVGYLSGSGLATVEESYNLGAVEGGPRVGGLIGHLYYGAVYDSYSRGPVSGVQDVGGLVGHANTNYSKAYRSYSTGVVSGTTNVGGLLGIDLNHNAIFADCYWDTESSGQIASAGGTGKTTAQMQQQATFANYDFLDIWGIDEGDSYPTHRRTAAVVALHPVARSYRNNTSAAQTITVTANVTWTATSNDAWIQVTGGAAGRDNGVITYTVAANPLPDLRVGTITVAGQHGAITRTFTVRQAASLEITPQQRRHDAAASSGHEVGVTGNVPWTAQATAGWIVITSGDEGTNAGEVRYRVEDNHLPTPREGAITLSGGGLTRTLRVTQSGAVPALGIVPIYHAHGMGASAGHSSTVSANISWTATTADDWITVTSGGNGAGDGTVVYSVDANLAPLPRLGAITVSGGNRLLAFRVHQALSWRITVSANDAAGGSVSGGGYLAAGQPLTVTATANPGYRLGGWTEDGVAVSTDSEYALTATRNRDLTAVFLALAPVSKVTLSYRPTGALLVGNPVRLTVQADGERPLAYAWTLNGGPVGENRDTWETLLAVAGTYTVGVTVTNVVNGAYAQVVLTAIDPSIGKPDLSLSDKVGSLTSVESGDVLTYSLFLRNTTDVAATATLTDPIPAYTTYLAGSASASDKGAVTLNAGALVWHGQVISGTPVLVQFAVMVGDAPIGAGVVNTATVADGRGQAVQLSAGSRFNPGYRFSINDGALATNVPTVTLRYAWNVEDAIAHVQFCNDGGFGAGASAWLPVDAEKPTLTGWVLETYGDYRMPYLVYARFRDAVGRPYGPIMDWIIYDPDAPRIQKVEVLRGGRHVQASGDNVVVRITASDGNTGVAQVQLSHTADFAACEQADFAGPITNVPWTLDGGGRVYVRAVDRAGNVSEPVSAEPVERIVFLPVVMRAGW